MGRKNLDGTWRGPSTSITARLGRPEVAALLALRQAWGGTDSEIIRRALREAAQRASAREAADPES